tara:strand:- start:1298 stop:1630 length:333 start_codon:yes stop_codon:yes gene_type:complete
MKEVSLKDSLKIKNKMKINYQQSSIEEEEDIIYRAMYDTYLIILSKSTFEEIVARHESFGEDTVLFINVFENKKDINPEIVEEVIHYFSYLEEYEKCAELVKFKKEQGWM